MNPLNIFFLNCNSQEWRKVRNIDSKLQDSINENMTISNREPSHKILILKILIVTTDNIALYDPSTYMYCFP